MDSDLQQQQYSHHFQSKQQMSSAGGLTRYRSAPSSYFSSFMEAADNAAAAGDLSQPHPQPRPLSPETESILARFMENVAEGGNDSQPHKLYGIPENSPLIQPPFMGSVKHEAEQTQTFSSANNNNHSTTTTTSNTNNDNIKSYSSSQMNYRQNSNSIETNFRLPNSGYRTNSNLMRHRSSPAGLFDDIIIEDGFLVNKEIGNYGSSNRTTTNNQINFSSADTQMTAGISDGTRRYSNGDDDSLINGFPVSSWDDSAMFTGPESSGSDFNSPENQKREGRVNRPATGLLSHHLSLPKASIEKLLKFEESVPCKMRAKRGFATHPRSIAERVRRTKISDRMRKLQDLVPNMDKQTNTSDMLDFAVEYIKDLQKQVTILTDKRDKCTCGSLEEA